MSQPQALTTLQHVLGYGDVDAISLIGAEVSGELASTPTPGIAISQLGAALPDAGVDSDRSRFLASRGNVLPLERVAKSLRSLPDDPQACTSVLEIAAEAMGWPLVPTGQSLACAALELLFVDGLPMPPEVRRMLMSAHLPLEELEFAPLLREFWRKHPTGQHFVARVSVWGAQAFGHLPALGDNQR